MTDSYDDGIGRLDLRALDVEADPDRENAIVAAALARIGRPNDVAALLMLRRRLTLAAAILLAVAGASLLLTRRENGAADGESLLLSWAQSGHAPTNGELLAIYRGYQP